MDDIISLEDNTGLIDRYNIRETAAFLHANGHRTIAAQFPDQHLDIAPRVSHILQDICKREFEGYRVTVYVLADTTYNSLGVDEVASSHVEADCVVHYGRASLAPVTGKIAVYYVFPKEDRYRMDEDVWFSMDLGGQCVVFVDQIYSHVMDEVMSYVREHVQSDKIEFPELLATRCDSGVGGYASSVREYNHANITLVWFGSSESPAKEELMLTYNGYTWISIHPMDGKIERGLPRMLEQTLRKRYYLVEKARDASIVGILVGTLGAAGYKDSINSLRIAAQEAGKKTYTLLMGKPNPAKLANFPEIDIFVLVADPQGHILDSKEYYKPIITPHEAMIAFSDEATWEQHNYSLNLCVETKEKQTDCCQGQSCQTLALQAQEALQISETYGSTKAITAGSSAQYLVHSRTWKGVEAPCAGSNAKSASRIQKGLHGRAATYENK